MSKRMETEAPGVHERLREQRAGCAGTRGPGPQCPADESGSHSLATGEPWRLLSSQCRELNFRKANLAALCGLIRGAKDWKRGQR